MGNPDHKAMFQNFRTAAYDNYSIVKIMNSTQCINERIGVLKFEALVTFLNFKTIAQKVK